MKALKFIRVLIVSAAVVFAVSIAGAQANSADNNLRILFTHDMHDHILPNRIDIDGEVFLSGGYSCIPQVSALPSTPTG